MEGRSGEGCWVFWAMLFDGYKPFLADLQRGGDVGQEEPPEGVNVVLGGEGFARAREKAPAKILLFCLGFECV